MTVVTLYHAAGCHLCDRAREVLLSVREELEFELLEVDISGDPELEASYREWLPVVEIDGERAFVYTSTKAVSEDVFRELDREQRIAGRCGLCPYLPSGSRKPRGKEGAHGGTMGSPVPEVAKVSRGG